MIDVTLDVRQNDVEQWLQAIVSALSGDHVSRYLRDEMVAWLRERARMRFQQEGDDAVGGPWLPLAESTNTIREQRGFPREHPINKRTGELEDYITRGQFGLVANEQSATLSFPTGASGELKKKLETAQKGRSDPSTPARPVIGLSNRDLIHFTETFVLWFHREVRTLV